MAKLSKNAELFRRKSADLLHATFIEGVDPDEANKAWDKAFSHLSDEEVQAAEKEFATWLLDLIARNS